MRTLTCITLFALSSGPTETDINAFPETSEVVLQTGSSWDDSPYAAYRPDRPELSLVRVRVAANTTLPWHCHAAPSIAYVLSGTLLVETETGYARVVVAGQALPEVVDTAHRGHAGLEPVDILMFFAGTTGLPLSQSPGECGQGSRESPVGLD